MFIVLPVLIILHVLVCLLMVFVVLMQRPRSEGLGAAFGGGVTENIFGAQTTNVLAKFTTWLALAFFAITLLLSIITAKSSSGNTAIQKELLSAPVPVASPQAAASPAAATEAMPATEGMSSPEAASAPTAMPSPEAMTGSEAAAPVASPTAN